MSYESECEKEHRKDLSKWEVKKKEEVEQRQDASKWAGKKGETGDVGRKGLSKKIVPKKDCGNGAKGANGKKGVV